jgi:hypothetical protein
MLTRKRREVNDLLTPMLADWGANDLLLGAESVTA